MKIKSIDIYNFRNYKKANINFNDNINIFIGNNGVGKTNILESIYVLAITKSHRSHIDKNLITNEKNIMKISGIIQKSAKEEILELLINAKGKRVSINKQISKRISDYISNLVVILFSPDDLDLIKGNPGVRRKYLNIEIGQIDNKYLYYLNEYNELLRNRNEYLKITSIDKINKKYIEIINNQLCDKALLLYKYRYEYIKDINKYIKDISLNFENSNLELKYINNLGTKEYDASIREKLLNKLENNLKREILLGTTLYGPHKDDFEINYNNISVRDYGSQGQQRLCVLLMKFAELELYKEKKQEYPILLLDDIFSELDIEKRNAIVNYLNKNIQVFITSTDINDIDKSLLSKSKIFKITNGTIN